MLREIPRLLGESKVFLWGFVLLVADIKAVFWSLLATSHAPDCRDLQFAQQMWAIRVAPGAARMWLSA